VSSHSSIAAILGSEILRGTHPPGAKLPSEPDLLKRFRVSRTVMREVTKTLAAKGLVASKTRVGTRVREPAHWNFFDTDVLAWRVRSGLDADFLRSLTEIRRALEPAAAALAAQRRSTADLAKLRRSVSEMARSGHTRKSFAETDLAFHLTIGVASGNPLMGSAASVIEAALLSSLAYASAADDPRNQESAVQRHAAIVDAIDARDSQAAADAMRRVIDEGERRIDARRGKRLRKP
jgi:DNA-binding FadR family transcriptional regulator